MLYFAFGSNMSSKRIQNRVPSARFAAVATLPSHRLRFHKFSKDGSGKGDAEWTGQPEDRVVGVVFNISRDDKPLLDALEGLGFGYDEKTVDVVTEDGETLSAVMYFATDIDPALTPYEWYMNHVLIGAREHGLPIDYIWHVEAVETIADPDLNRAAREVSLYR